MHAHFDALHRVTIWMSLTIALSSSVGCSRAANGGDRLVLENGVTVLIKPIAGVNQVGVEALYDVGFMHEPKGMTQASHLLEHLVCYGPSESFGQKEAMQKLSAMGMANAETLPSFTHYDYTLPANQLPLVLQIEHERLTSLSFDNSLVEAEAKRCYQETDAVESNPSSGMVKHAFMAFSQAWRHGADRALVRGGLEEMQLEELRSFHRSYYRPDKLTLVVVGDFDIEKAKRLIQEGLGSLEPSAPTQATPIDWAALPKRQTVRWDANVSGVCLSFPPPSDLVSSAALSLFGTLLMQQLIQDAEISAVADLTICTNYTWKVDPLPFFVYAAAKRGASLEQVERVLKTRLLAISHATKSAARQIPRLAGQLQQQAASLNKRIVEMQARQLKNMQGMDESRAAGMVITQSALNWGMVDRLLGPNPQECISELKSMAGPKLEKLIDDTLDEGRMLVTYVLPE